MTDTATPADRLAAYRSRHVIEVVGNAYTGGERCLTDGIRVHGTRDGRWRHDNAEIVALMEAEYGRPWDAPKAEVGFPR